MLMLFLLAVSAQTLGWLGNRRRGNRADRGEPAPLNDSVRSAEPLPHVSL